MSASVEDIYASENGDRWQLVRDAASGRVFVRHKANPSSGGHITDMDVDWFLNRGGGGPEYAALRRLLDRPAEGVRDDEATAPSEAELVVSVEIGGTRMFQHKVQMMEGGGPRTLEVLVTENPETLQILKHALTESLLRVCSLDGKGDGPEPLWEDEQNASATNGVYHFPVNDD
jgi:hypothetical protein